VHDHCDWPVCGSPYCHAAHATFGGSPKRVLLWQTKSVCHTELALDSQTAEDINQPSFSICILFGRKFPFLCAGATSYRSLRSCASHKIGNFHPIHCQTIKAIPTENPSRLRVQGGYGVANAFCLPKQNSLWTPTGGGMRSMAVRRPAYRPVATIVHLPSCSSWFKINLCEQ
jgi:hypothetical protein